MLIKQKQTMENQTEINTQPSEAPSADDISVLRVLLHNIKGISAVSSTDSVFDLLDELPEQS